MTSFTRTLIRSLSWAAALAATAVLLAGTPQAQAPLGGALTANPFRQLHFRFIGPMGGRVAAIAGVPGEPDVAYIGSADGGIFKTSDYATTWRPIFDHEHTGAIGALAVAPSAHNIVWAGTGEPWVIRAAPDLGDGVYRSTDSGRSWTHMGLDATGHVANIAIDPQDANVVYVCAVGQFYRTQPERGVFKTADGGRTWQKVLFVDEQTGCSDLAMDPHDPDTLFAGMWQVTVHTWDLHSGGPSSGLYVTHDAGAHWAKSTGNGLPSAGEALGRVSVKVAPTDSRRVYALFEQHPPGFYRSDNGGRTWHLVSHSYALGGRMPYDSRFGVSSGDENLLYFLGTRWAMSRDGGKTLVENPLAAGSDLHNIWMDPDNPNHYMVSDDTGGSITWNGGRTYNHIILPNAQLYHAYPDRRVPYRVFANKQDGGSMGVPSNNLDGPGGIGYGDLFHAAACESGFVVPDPTDDNIAWVSCYDGNVGRLDFRTGEARVVSPWPDATFGWKPADVKYRFNWTMPLLISPHDHHTVYVAGQNVMKTTDDGQSWTVISPDLTLDDKSHEQASGGVTPYDLFTFEGETIFSLAESPVKADVLWAGTSDGQVSLTQDGGAHWTTVTKNVPGLPPWGTVENIAASPFAPGTAYITVNLEQMGDYHPYVYRTTDFGRTWTDIGKGVPDSVLSFPNCIIEDPVREGMLYLGTGNGLYVSWDDGAQWTSLRNNLPPTAIKWLAIQPVYHDLVVGTYGRGAWILDDVTPLRAWDKAAQADAYLFTPRPAYRYRQSDVSRSVVRNVATFGENPPAGTDLNFYLRQPAHDVTLTIRGAKGETVRTLQVNGTAGLNRVWWNLEYDPVHRIELRVPPEGAPWVTAGPTGWRSYESTIAYVGAPRVAPGTYTVQLSADGQRLSAPLTVERDPNGMATTKDLQANVTFQRQVLGELNRTVDTINRLEWDRKQIQDLEATLEGRGDSPSALAAARALDRRAGGLEAGMLVTQMTGGNVEEAFSYPAQLYERLVNLMEALGGQICCGGGVGGSAGLPPTSQEIAVNELYQQQFVKAEQDMRTFTDQDVPAFNATLRAAHLSAGIVP